MNMRISARFSRVSLAVAVALSGVTNAQAEENTEELVVWGTSVSSDSQYLGDQDMSLKQADHMSDLLRDIPGVDVGGTHSLNQRITIRSLGETDLDIRLDGASQHANMFHHIGNLTLNPDILKAVDIQVGNNSVTQSGLGGSVYFETKDGRDLLRPGEKYGARVFGGYATNSSQQGSLTVYGMLTENVDAMIYGHLVSRDNFEDGDGIETYGSEGDVGNVLAKIGYEPSYSSRFELSYDMYRDSGDYSPRPDMAGSANEGLSGDDLIPTDYDRDTLTASYELDGDIHTGKVSVYSSTTEITRDESAITGGWPANRHSENTATNQNVGVNATFQSEIDLVSMLNQFTYGIDYINKNSKSEYGGTKFMDEDAISTAVFIEDKVFLTNRFSITAGLRFDDYQRKAETSDTSFDDLTWGLGADWDITNSITLFASARSLFKGPELLETFVAYQDVAYLDDDIQPETGQNSQIGAKYSQHFGDHFVSSNITIFQTDIDDYIQEEYQSGSSSYLIYNAGDVEIKGFEVSASYGYGSLMSKLSYARSESNNKTTGEAMQNAWGISADVGDSISFAVDYQADSIDTLFGWTSNFVMEEDNVLEGDPVKEAYNVHNIYVQWAPADIEDLQVTFGVDNIFDELYVSHASRSGAARGVTLDDYEPGRNFKLSAAYQF